MDEGVELGRKENISLGWLILMGNCIIQNHWSAPCWSLEGKQVYDLSSSLQKILTLTLRWSPSTGPVDVRMS